MPKRILYDAGYRFPNTRLTVIENLPTEKGESRVLCKCDCGNTLKCIPDQAKRQNTISCGCFKSESTIKRNLKHGLRHHPLYKVWADMVARCTNPNEKSYKDYGGRLETPICDEWFNFHNFYNDMQDNYKRGLEIDRINNDLGYSKDNCRWVIKSKNLRNKRNNRLITINGVTHCIVEWAEISGINARAIWKRLKRGWEGEKILSSLKEVS